MNIEFSAKKKRALAKYEPALQKGLVDLGAIPINDLINDQDGYYTTSSCTGRGIVISKDHVRSKYHTTFHFKTHDPSKIEDLDILKTIFHGQLWFIVEPVNWHIVTDADEKLTRMQKLAIKAKLAYSKIQSLSPNKVVEIQGTSKLATPLGTSGRLHVDEEYVAELKIIATDLLTEEKKRMSRWEKMLRHMFNV